MDNATLNVVPREQWQKFFDRWSQAHSGDLITLSGLLDDAQKPDPISAPLPLVGISLDPRGSEAGHLIIMLGDTPNNHHQHILADIAQVSTRADPDDADSTYLELTRADGNAVGVQAGSL